MLASEPKIMPSVRNLLDTAVAKFHTAKQMLLEPIPAFHTEDEEHQKVASILFDAKVLTHAAMDLVKPLEVGPGEELETKESKYGWIDILEMLGNSIRQQEIFNLMTWTGAKIKDAVRQFSAKDHKEVTLALRSLEKAELLSRMALEMSHHVRQPQRSVMLEGSMTMMRTAKEHKLSFAEQLVSDAEVEFCEKLDTKKAYSLLFLASAVAKSIRQDIEAREKEEKAAAADGLAVTLTFDFDHPMKQRAYDVERSIKEMFNIFEAFRKGGRVDEEKKILGEDALKSAAHLLQIAKELTEGPTAHLDFWKGLKEARAAKLRIDDALKWLSIQDPVIRDLLLDHAKDLKRVIDAFEREKTKISLIMKPVERDLVNSAKLVGKHAGSIILAKGQPGHEEEIQRLDKEMIEIIEQTVRKAMNAAQQLPEPLRSAIIEKTKEFRDTSMAVRNDAMKPGP